MIVASKAKSGWSKVNYSIAWTSLKKFLKILSWIFVLPRLKTKRRVITVASCNSACIHDRMTSAENKKSICGLPYLYSKDVAQLDDTDSVINDAVVAAVNASCCVFAFLGNLLIIVATVKTPSLHKPSTILVCSLAFAGCLSCVTTQPLFIVRLLVVHRADISCDYQLKLYILHRCSYKLITLLFFASLAVISFDRHYALSKPLQYRADASNSGKTWRTNWSTHQSIHTSIHPSVPSPLRK